MIMQLIINKNNKTKILLQQIKLHTVFKEFKSDFRW